METTYTRKFLENDFSHAYERTSKYRYVVLTYDLTLGLDEGFEPLYKRYFNNKQSAQEFCVMQKLTYGDAYVIDFADSELSNDMWEIIKTEAILL